MIENKRILQTIHNRVIFYASCPRHVLLTNHPKVVNLMIPAEQEGYILLETGDTLLTESGDKIILE
jgi:hypothetical protein